jgi:hypothetical protein
VDTTGRCTVPTVAVRERVVGLLRRLRPTATEQGGQPVGAGVVGDHPGCEDEYQAGECGEQDDG